MSDHLSKIPSSWQSKLGFVKLGGPPEFNGAKVFSATMLMDRDRLGEKVTAWMDRNPHCEIRDATVTQSSDEAFHCIAITLFFWEDLD